MIFSGHDSLILALFCLNTSQHAWRFPMIASQQGHRRHHAEITTFWGRVGANWIMTQLVCKGRRAMGKVRYAMCRVCIERCTPYKAHVAQDCTWYCAQCPVCTMNCMLRSEECTCTVWGAQYSVRSTQAAIHTTPVRAVGAVCVQSACTVCVCVCKVRAQCVQSVRRVCAQCSACTVCAHCVKCVGKVHAHCACTCVQNVRAQCVQCACPFTTNLNHGQKTNLQIGKDGVLPVSMKLVSASTFATSPNYAQKRAQNSPYILTTANSPANKIGPMATTDQ